MTLPSERTSTSNYPEKPKQLAATFDEGPGYQPRRDEDIVKGKTSFEKSFDKGANEIYSEMLRSLRKPFAIRIRAHFSKGGTLNPFRLLRQDVRNIRKRYMSDWTLFNQLVFASAVYM